MTIKEQIVIMLDSYDLRLWTNTLIQKCVEDNPNMDVKHLAKLLGISPRTITRKAYKGHIRISKADREKFSLALDKDLEQIKHTKNGK